MGRAGHTRGQWDKHFFVRAIRLLPQVGVPVVQGGSNFISRGECFSRFSRTDISFAEFPQTRRPR
jgi:hypothetical protein